MRYMLLLSHTKRTGQTPRILRNPQANAVIPLGLQNVSSLTDDLERRRLIMSTRRFAVVVGFLVLCCLLYPQSGQTSSATIPAGYQLLPAQVTLTSPTGPFDQHRVFLLDS